ncbi:MAG TPA: RNA polymerase sigma factor [Verrucomicrobiales bacterium]|nr:RNA polymerase sigma factor [Verrucomicrobiales bacterium]
MVSALSTLRRVFASRPSRVDWQRACDTELVLAARRRDRAGKEAFVEIVRRYQTAVYAAAYSIAGRMGETDDVAQESFMNAWKGIETLREPAKLKSWLTRIAHDCAVRALRRDRQHAPLDGETLRLTEAPVAAPDAAAVDAEEERFVWETLAGLPETLRVPLVLFYCEGQSVAAVAAALDLSEDAVKQRLCRGRKEMQEQVAARVSEGMESKLAGILGRVRPPAILIVSVASAIGLLIAPATLAAGAFSSASAGAGAGSSAAATSTFSTAMTASSYLIATLTMAAFIPLGWKAREPAAPPVLSEPPVTAAKKITKPADPFALFKRSALLKEWRRLHEEHGSTPEAMPLLYKDIAALKDPFHRRALRPALLAEWAAVDPQGAWQYLVVEKKRTDHALLMVQEWLRLDPAQAADHLTAQVAAAPSLTRSLLNDIAKTAPDRLGAIVAQLPASANPWDRSVQSAFMHYAQNNPSAARAAAEALSGRDRQQAIAGAVSGWAEKDGPAALTYARSLPEGAERNEALQFALIGWAKENPFTALDHLKEASTGDGTRFDSNTTAQVLAAASAKDFDGALRWLEQHDGIINREAWWGLNEALSKRISADPAGTLSFLASEPPAMRDGLRTVLSNLLYTGEGFAQRDAIWEWAKTQPPGGIADQVREMLMNAAASRDPELLRKFAAESPSGLDAGSAALVISQLINKGADLSHFDEFLAIVPADRRQKLLADAFGSAALWHTDNLQPWIDRLATLPENLRREATSTLAAGMAGNDPEAAVRWASSLQTGRDTALETALGVWVHQDSFAVSAWAAKLPAGVERDIAAHALVHAVAASDPDAAWEWAMGISDPDRRAAAFSHAFKAVRSQDQQRAQQFLASLPPESPEAQKLMEQMKQPDKASSGSAVLPSPGPLQAFPAPGVSGTYSVSPVESTPAPR